MAITRDTKNVQVAAVAKLILESKMIAFAHYAGVSVAEIQELRRSAKEAGVTIKVVKNRLVRVAMEQSDTYKDTDTALLIGQLLYATSVDDEVAPAQVLAQFAKKYPALKLAGGFDGNGASLDEARIKAMADLPSKDQLRGMLVSTLAAPLTGFMGVINGAQRGFAQVLSQRAEKLETA